MLLLSVICLAALLARPCLMQNDVPGQARRSLAIQGPLVECKA